MFICCFRNVIFLFFYVKKENLVGEIEFFLNNNYLTVTGNRDLNAKKCVYPATEGVCRLIRRFILKRQMKKRTDLRHHLVRAIGR